QLDGLCLRLRAPNDCRALAMLVQREADAVDHSGSLDASGLVTLLTRCDALRKPLRFEALLQACRISALVDGRTSSGIYPPEQRLRAALAAAQGVATEAIARQAMDDGKTGPAVGAAIDAARVAAVAAVTGR
ncbi:MAG: multifunctional CCA tRNA nucleotidyl transferase/2'3'-cyclic phosphodiesterase/2'nucleotidase/phosphatase, partial [Burkholderiaceae bacterium]